MHEEPKECTMLLKFWCLKVGIFPQRGIDIIFLEIPPEHSNILCGGLPEDIVKVSVIGGGSSY